MWRNYLTVGLRALAKSRVYAAINIFGLAVGMAACLMILLYVRYERSYDTWLPGAADTYELQSWYADPDTGEEDQLQMTSYVAGKAFKKDFPQVQEEVYVMSSEPVWRKGGEVLPTENFVYTDGNLLSVLNLPVLAGNARDLNRPGTAAITQEEAIKRFGTDRVVGRTFTIIAKGQDWLFRVVAVLRDIPKNSHFKASTIGRIDLATFMSREPDFLTCWGCQSGWVYARLKPGTDPKALEAQFHAWEKRNIADDTAGGVKFNQGDDQEWHLVNARDIHLGRAQSASMTPGNDARTMVTFSVIALLILGMACVNFTNLSTARASQRAREVSLRKVLGADRKHLIIQFLTESVMVACFAMVLALAMVELLLPAYANFLDADLSLHYFGRDGVLLPAILLAVMVGVAGGLYPAFFLSRFQPAQVLKANKSAADAQGSGALRNILVIGQFAVSIGLIICTAVIYLQTVYARTVDPGYKRDHIVQVDNLSRYQLINQGDAIVEQLRRVPGVDAVGRTTIGVATTNNSNSSILVPGNPKGINIGQYLVDPGFKDAMGLQLVAGRWFDDRQMDDATRPFPDDKAVNNALVVRGANVVMNQKAVERLGFRNPDDIIGKTFRHTGYVNEETKEAMAVTVVGVVRDSRFRSVRDPLDPITFFKTSSGHTHAIIRYHGDPLTVRAGLEKVWKGITRDVPFEAEFSEDVVKRLYKAEDARAETFVGFALLSVIIGCLGLFGLAAFTAERRTKEIGIRKVLGARTQDIVRLLVWQFSRPVLIANLIAWPIAWWVMRDWLNGFDQRIGLGPTPFLLAGALALFIAVATIAGHAIKVARASPIRALRYE